MRLIGGPMDGNAMPLPRDLPDVLPILWPDGEYRRARRCVEVVYVWTRVASPP